MIKKELLFVRISSNPPLSQFNFDSALARLGMDEAIIYVTIGLVRIVKLFLGLKRNRVTPMYHNISYGIIKKDMDDKLYDDSCWYVMNNKMIVFSKGDSLIN